MKHDGKHRYIGDQIRARREFLGLSQRALGAMVGLTQNNISQHEMGRRTMNLDTLLRYCAALRLMIVIDGDVVWVDSASQPRRDLDVV